MIRNTKEAILGIALILITLIAVFSSNSAGNNDVEEGLNIIDFSESTDNQIRNHYIEECISVFSADNTEEVLCPAMVDIIMKECYTDPRAKTSAECNEILDDRGY